VVQGPSMGVSGERERERERDRERERERERERHNSRFGSYPFLRRFLISIITLKK